MFIFICSRKYTYRSCVIRFMFFISKVQFFINLCIPFLFFLFFSIFYFFRFSDAIVEIDNLKFKILNFDFKNSGHSKSSNFSNLFGPFEIYDHKIISEFSQKNIFYGIDPFFSFDDKSDNNISINKTNGNDNNINGNIYTISNDNDTDENEYKYNSYINQILSQIEDKKNRLMYLQKHYE
jgi:hypothetical protein